MYRLLYLKILIFARGFINLYIFKFTDLWIYTIFCMSTDLRIPRSRFSHRFLAFYDPGCRMFLFLVAGTASVFSGDDEGTLDEKCGKCALRLWREMRVTSRAEHYSFECVTGIDIVIILHTVKLPSKWCVWSCSLSYADANHFSFVYICTAGAVIVVRRLCMHSYANILTPSHIILYNNSMPGFSIANCRFQSRILLF